MTNKLIAKLLVEIYEQFGGYIALVYMPDRTRRLFNCSWQGLQEQITNIIKEKIK